MVISLTQGDSLLLDRDVGHLKEGQQSPRRRRDQVKIELYRRRHIKPIVIVVAPTIFLYKFIANIVYVLILFIIPYVKRFFPSLAISSK